MPGSGANPWIEMIIGLGDENKSLINFDGKPGRKGMPTTVAEKQSFTIIAKQDLTTTTSPNEAAMLIDLSGANYPHGGSTVTDMRIHKIEGRIWGDSNADTSLTIGWLSDTTTLSATVHHLIDVEFVATQVDASQMAEDYGDTPLRCKAAYTFGKKTAAVTVFNSLTSILEPDGTKVAPADGDLVCWNAVAADRVGYSLRIHYNA